MSISIVASPDAKTQEHYIEWDCVPRHLKTRSGWDALFRKIKKGEEPLATVATMKVMRLECADVEYEVPGHTWNLYQQYQTEPIKETPLNVARQQFWEVFGLTNERSKLIRWTKGDWVQNEFGEKVWDSTVDVWGWKTFGKEWFTKPKCIDHDTGREIYGVFGAEKSFYLFIDLDLHKQPIQLFLKRLAVLLVAFHGKYGCHFQVSDENAGGVHLILHFDKPSPLKGRVRWLERTLARIDEAFPECEFFRTQSDGSRKLNIEVYPNTAKAHRLPLARRRKMLLDSPLELVSRRGRESQDIVAYMNWLSNPDRSFMPKDDVYRYIVDRLDLSCSASACMNGQQTCKTSISNEQTSKESTSKSLIGEFEPENLEMETCSIKRSYPLKGKTRGAIIGFWQRGEPGHFENINSAIYITLMALRAEGGDRKQAVDVVMQYVRDLPNTNLSSRLPDRLPEIERIVERDSLKIWNSGINGTWNRSAARWSEIGFRVDNQSTWAVSGSTPDVVVDCEEVLFSDQERQLIVDELAPLIVGAKQALKPEKQAEVERAVAYFLRFVRCCDREIPVHGLPKILSKFNLKFGQHEKQRQFFKKLSKWKWIYLRADYYHPAKHGGKAEKGRARAYGIGKAMNGKFTLPKRKREQEEWSYILSSTFCETTGFDLEIGSFDDQMSEMLASKR